MLSRLINLINVILTPVILFMYWPNLGEVGTLAFIIIPCWAAIFWLESAKAILSKEEA